jgi:hypothetical protein
MPVTRAPTPADSFAGLSSGSPASNSDLVSSGLPTLSPSVDGRATYCIPDALVQLVRQNPVVPHLRLIGEDEAIGELQSQYDAAVARAGKVFNIVKAMSLNPGILGASMGLYRAIMFGPSELSRAERELLAVVVSCANDCHY